MSERDERDALLVTMVALGIIVPVPDCGYDDCKRYAMEHVDLSDWRAERIIRESFDKVNVADMIMGLAQNTMFEGCFEKLNITLVKQREDTGNRQLLRFQAGNFSAPFLP